MADDDDRELFERALESMSAGDVYQGKYGRPTESSEDDSESDEAPDSAAREELARLREERQMQDAFADVQPLDQRDKYHRTEPPPVDLDVDVDSARAEFEAAMAGESTDEPPPEPTLADLVTADTHSINLRGTSPEEALRQLGLFVDLASKDGHELIRVKVGSNRPLLEALQEWFRGPGALYTLEFETGDPENDASIFARIRHQERS